VIPQHADALRVGLFEHQTRAVLARLAEATGLADVDVAVTG
jgi:hypothetical protein